MDSRQTRTPEELYRVVMHNKLDPRSCEIARAFVRIQAEVSQSYGWAFDPIWTANIAYTAGRIEGIRQERERKRGSTY